jgi:hypothetical protein
VVPNTTNKIAIASLTALGGALSGCISRTFLRVYERTLLQLNFFFQVALVSNSVLTAERRTTKMQRDSRDASYQKMIETVLAISTRSISASETLVRQTATSPRPVEGSGSSSSGPPEVTGSSGGG